MSDEDESKPLLLGRKRFVLESISCVYFLAKFATLPLIQQYVYYLAERKHNLTQSSYKMIETYIHNVEVNRSIYDQNTTNLESLDSRYEDSLTLVKEINKEASATVLYLTLAECLPAAITIVVFGLSSDVIGKRKFMMWLPCFGNSLFVLGFILPEYVSRASLDSTFTMVCFYVACIISGFSGSTAGFLSGSASYISDIHLLEKRTERLAIIELVIGLTAGSAALFNGLWISNSDRFEVPMWIIFSLSFIAGVGIICLLPEPYPKFYQVHESFSSKVIQVLAQGKKIFTGLKLNLETWLIFISFMIYVLIQHGQERSYVLFLINHPLSWKPIQLGVFLFLVYVFAGLGSWPGYRVLKKFLSDVDVFIVSLVSMFLGTLVMVVTQNIIVIYFSAFIKLFHLLPYAVSRSLISQQVDKENQGSIYAIVHSMLALSSFLGPVLHLWIFTRTLNIFNGFSFIFSAILMVPAVCLLSYIKAHGYKQKDYSDIGSVVYDPQLKEEGGKLNTASETTD